MIGPPGFKFQGLELTSTYLASPDSAVFSPKFGVEGTSTRCRLEEHTGVFDSTLRRSVSRRTLRSRQDLRKGGREFPRRVDPPKEDIGYTGAYAVTPVKRLNGRGLAGQGWLLIRLCLWKELPHSLARSPAPSPPRAWRRASRTGLLRRYLVELGRRRRSTRRSDQEVCGRSKTVRSSRLVPE